jgi:GntR family transcriptional regulator
MLLKNEIRLLTGPCPTDIVYYVDSTQEQPMHVRIDPASGIAIYEQIVRAVKFAVARGTLVAGELVPSVRELALQLAVNPNTVARAYRDLQAAGLLVPVRGTGLEVSAGAAVPCRRERLELIRERLRSVLEEAVGNDISFDELGTMFREELERTGGLNGRKRVVKRD